MIFLCFCLIYSKIIDYNKKEDFFADGDKPVIGFYYLDFSKAITKEKFKQLSLCSRVLPDLRIVRINCSKFPDVCQDDYTQDQLIKMINPSYHVFMGEIIAFDIVTFLEAHTSIQRTKIPTSYAELSPDNFSDYLKSKRSSLIAFLDLSEKISQIMIPQIQQIAFIYSSNLRTGVAYLDCNKYLDFCIDNNVEFAPTFRAYRKDNTKYKDYLGSRIFENLLNFSNEELHENRFADGELNKEAGVIKSIYPLVEVFMKSEVKSEAIRQIQNTEGSEYYMTIIKKLLRKGEEALEIEENKIRKMLSVTQDKLATRDVLRCTLNVLKEFKKAGPYTPPSHTDSEL